MSLIEIILKLLLAVALGGLVGLERESSQKPAGFRTNILICVGATMMMVLSGLLLQEQGEGKNDITRIAAGTTAATLWAMAGLGLVIGAGHYLIATIFTAIIILTLLLFRQIEAQYLKKSFYHYHLKAKYSKDILVNIKKLALHEGLKFEEVTLKKEGDLSSINFSFQTTEEKEHKFNQSLLNMGEVSEIKIE